MNIPADFARYFWDVEIEGIGNYPIFVIERLLEYGDKKAVSFLFDSFSSSKIKAVLKQSRSLSKKSANFWAVYFNISKEEIRCLTMSFQEKHRKIWPY